MLPPNYEFEVQKTLHRIDQVKKELKKDMIRVSLQFPEGLMLFGCLISDIITTFTKCEVVMLGDVTYGACCVDDIASSELECDLLIHYGHSCLVPITDTKKRALYVFVEMKMDLGHFIETFMFNFP
jgi:2-(3-amino-3-carboxypropyl)histidine synthase